METAHKTTARDFFLYLLAVITLFISTWKFIDLLFEYINVLFPDNDFSYSVFGTHETIRLSMATLFIVFPIYMGITWFLRKDIIKNPEKRELRVRKWLLNFTLFAAAITIIVDLVTLVYNFLNGDLPTRFILKVIVVLITAGAVFAYYFWDLRRDTKPNSKPSLVLAIIVSAIIASSVLAGFFIIGSPATQRSQRFDERRTEDLGVLQNEIVNYYINKKRVPGKLEDLKNDISGFIPPQDPETKASYEYNVIAPLKFELCAVFNLPTPQWAKTSKRTPYMAEPYGQNWDHEKGRACFSRTIDPDLYKNIVGKPMSVPIQYAP